MTRNVQSGIRPGIRRLLGLDIPQRDALAAQLEDELQLHLDLRAEQLQREGLSDEAAAREARIRYGNVAAATLEIRSHAGRREQHLKRRITFDSLSLDIRFAFRTLTRTKAWTTVAVFTLALGIGANTAVFSVVNDLLLNPLRYPGANRLVYASRLNAKSNLQVDPTIAQARAWRAARSFDGIEGIGSEKQTLQVTNGDPGTAHVAQVASTFARFAGARALVGRFIGSDDEKADAPAVALLSEHVWRNQFGAVPDIVGKIIRLQGKQVSVIGVMPDGVRIPSYIKEPVDVWIPLPAKGFLSGPVVGRLAAGATMKGAEEELRSIAKTMEQSANSVNGAQFDINLRAPGSSGQSRTSLLMLTGAVCLLLLIACANVAHLLLARGAGRERELAVRAALGAGRGRIVRQLVTESLMLSLAGCMAGLAVGAMSLRAIIALRPANMEELANARIGLRVLLATIALSAVSGVAFGMVAAFSGRGGRSFEVLRSSIGSTNDRIRTRLRSLLVVTENALSVVLLIGAVLLIRTVVNLHQIDPGFDAMNLYAMTIALPDDRYSTPASRQLYADHLLTDARRIPGLQQATIAANPPSRTDVIIGNWIGEGGRVVTNSDAVGFTAMNTVRPDYFDLIRMHLVTGQTFTANAVKNHEVIVSRSMAQKLWGDTNVVGRRMRMENKRPGETEPVIWNVVVGVAPDAALISLTDKGETAGIYFPMESSPDDRMTLIVRMRPGNAPVAAFRRVFLSIDHSISPPEVVSVTELLLSSVASQRFMMSLLTLFALLAVALSAVGLYGVITYMVSQSTREIGVRVALGAARRDVIQLVMRKGITLSLLGLGIGLAASLWGGRLLTHMLYGVTAMDPLSYIAGSFLLLLIAIGACIAPTIRAVRIDPMLAMRSE